MVIYTSVPVAFNLFHLDCGVLSCHFSDSPIPMQRIWTSSIAVCYGMVLLLQQVEGDTSDCSDQLLLWPTSKQINEYTSKWAHLPFLWKPFLTTWNAYGNIYLFFHEPRDPKSLWHIILNILCGIKLKTEEVPEVKKHVTSLVLTSLSTTDEWFCFPKASGA